jgi:non-heme chloroperoxidase
MTGRPAAALVVSNVRGTSSLRALALPPATGAQPEAWRVGRVCIDLYAFAAYISALEVDMTRRPSHRFWSWVLLPAFALLWVVVPPAASGQQPQTPASPLQAIEVNGTKLHYVLQGSGEPVVFVHGTLGSYETFQRPFEALSSSFRVVAFSRRFHPPNEIPRSPEPYAMQMHVDDLAALVKALRIGPAHVVGHSYGAYVALAFALQHPELVRSLVLGEPPVLELLQNSSVGKTWHAALQRTLTMARAAFQDGNVENGVRHFLDAALGEGGFDRLPSEVRTGLLSAGPALRLELQTEASKWMVPLACDALGSLNRPVLLVTGERSVPWFHVITLELERCLTGEAHVMVSDADHGLHVANPDFYVDAVRRFLQSSQR